MLYTEFKKNYKWMLNKYPDTSYLFTDAADPEKIFQVTIKHQEKNGRKWETVSETTEQADFIYYSNTIDAIPFFRNLGGRELVTTEYTKAGYIPTEIISTSPSKEERTIRTFKYIK